MPPREKPILDKITYPSKKALLEYTKRLLSTRGECIIKPGDKDFNFFKDLHARNPKHIHHLDKVSSFKIGRDSTSSATNKVSCIDIDGSEHVFSWNDCVDRKSSNKNDRYIAAMRQAIHPQTMSFSSKKDHCELCGTNDKCDKYEVDHINDFIDLVNDFNTKNSVIIPDKFDRDEIGIIGQNCFRKEDGILKTKWLEYHKEHAKLQYLCKTCHDRKTYKKSVSTIVSRSIPIDKGNTQASSLRAFFSRPIPIQKDNSQSSSLRAFFSISK